MGPAAAPTAAPGRRAQAPAPTWNWRTSQCTTRVNLVECNNARSVDCLPQRSTRPTRPGHEHCCKLPTSNQFSPHFFRAAVESTARLTTVSNLSQKTTNRTYARHHQTHLKLVGPPLFQGGHKLPLAGVPAAGAVRGKRLLQQAHGSSAAEPGEKLGCQRGCMVNTCKCTSKQHARGKGGAKLSRMQGSRQVDQKAIRPLLVVECCTCRC